MSKKIRTSVSGSHFIVFGDEYNKYEFIETKENLSGKYHFVLKHEDKIVKDLITHQ